MFLTSYGGGGVPLIALVMFSFNDDKLTWELDWEWGLTPVCGPRRLKLKKQLIFEKEIVIMDSR